MIVILHPQVLEYTDAKITEILSSRYFSLAVSQLEFASQRKLRGCLKALYCTVNILDA